MQNVWTRLEIRHLRYFVTVAQELHFGRAARRLGMAQPPLSQQIAALEELLGARLFDRNSRRVQLTAAGTTLFDEAVRILSLSERLPTVVSNAASGQSGVLSVGFATSASLGLVPPLFRAFRKALPAVQLIIREGPTVDHLSAVAAGALDVALVRGPVDGATLQVTTLRREKVMLVMPSDHPLVSRSAVPWTALAALDVVMFPRTGSAPLYDAIIAQCVKANVSLRIVHEAGEWSTVSALVAAGAGLGFAPESASRFHVEGITFRPLKGGTAIAEIAAVFRPENMSPVLRAFVAIASNVT